MSARLPYSVAVVAVLLLASVAPFAGAGATGASTGPSASFGETVVREERGDVLNITVSTSKGGTVNLGSAQMGFWLQVDVGKGTTTLHINTYAVGRSSYSKNEWVWASNGNINGVTLRTDELSAPLAAARYPMNVTIGEDPYALGNFVVEERAIRGIDARVARRATDVESVSASGVDGTSSALADNATVARGDWVILHVNATGLNGVLSKRLLGDGSPKSVLDGDRHGVNLSIAQMDPRMNERPNRFTGARVERFLADGTGEGFYVFVDTGDHDIEAGDRYNVTFAVTADSPLADEREAVSTTFRVVKRRVWVNGSTGGLTVAGNATIDGTATLAPGTTVNVTVRDQGRRPFLRTRTVEITENYTFSAEFDLSHLRPGREFEVRLRDQDRTIPAVVEGTPNTTTGPDATTAPNTTTQSPDGTTADDPDGTATTAVDRTTNGTVTTADDTTARETTNRTTATTNGTTTTTESANATTANATTAPPATTTPEGLTPVAEGATERPLTRRTAVESGGVPGFDAGAALAALVAAALLAVRRS